MVDLKITHSTSPIKPTQQFLGEAGSPMCPISGFSNPLGCMGVDQQSIEVVAVCWITELNCVQCFFKADKSDIIACACVLIMGKLTKLTAQRTHTLHVQALTVTG